MTIGWLDSPPLEVCGRIDPVVRGRQAASPTRTLLAGPLEAITPWKWDWFDGNSSEV
jgi:hypothetical protein